MLLVVSAPSGCGKTTMVKRLLSLDPELIYSVSYTTRSPRLGEREGVDYHFVSPAAFEEMAASGAFAEWAEVHGERYATSARLIDGALIQGRDAVCDIDVQGAARLKERYPDAVLVFVLPPSMEELRRRLSGRNTEESGVVERRLAAARGELNQAGRYDYFIVNDDLEEAVERLHQVVLAERLRRGQRVCL
jgi:guanylate kinase